ncbi:MULTISPECIES: SDR family oxidoreductase [unclassified Nocardioides]|uniref:SDR family oxidoreductase n=1 Tax=unclassified Nocardioides TaxID=2615069 RepID=UPI0006FCCE04|nr:MULTISPECIES: SDR family oxidoreductase [unclassified Nocardioides]KQY57373.1 short-chain dehydrogenase [Nocardioides sp. Root140]KQZ68886.1 short-chain dehydrogenase [Nocardioides sp. Root151]KRF20437.1 short-chain dehydrogenase [Nocardioides sp. Soil796]
MTQRELDGQTLFVIGGGRGIGAAIATRARQVGMVVTVGARDPLAIDGAVRLDLTDEATIAAASAQIGAVDHVVTLGSLPHDAPVAGLDRDRMVAAFEAKVIGPILVAKHFEIRQSMTLFAGVVGWRPGPGSIVKGITNGAVDYAVRHLAANLAPVRVNAIAPGIIDSGAWDAKGEAKPAFLTGAAGQTLVGRHGELDDVVDAALWLIRSPYVDGETIHVDGGRR